MNNHCHIELLTGVCAFGLEGKAASTRTLQEENNVYILVYKFPLQNVSYCTFQNFTITKKKKWPIQIRT